MYESIINSLIKMTYTFFLYYLLNVHIFAYTIYQFIYCIPLVHVNNLNCMRRLIKSVRTNYIFSE